MVTPLQFICNKFYYCTSDIFDAMFAAKANAGDVIIQQGQSHVSNSVYCKYARNFTLL